MSSCHKTPQPSEVVHYRRYQPDDFAGLYAIEEVCFEPPERFSRAYMRELIEQPNAATWIAEGEGRIAGFAIVEWAVERSRLVAYVQTLEVLPELRQQGMGGRLLLALESSGQAAGAESIWLHVECENEPAIRLYERYGYGRAGKRKGFYGRGRDALIYAKSLRSAEAV